MAFRKRTRSASTRSGYKRRTSSPGRRRAAPARRKAAQPQVIKIVIENPQPQVAFPGNTLPDQVGQVQALTAPRRARF